MSLVQSSLLRPRSHLLKVLAQVRRPRPIRIRYLCARVLALQCRVAAAHQRLSQITEAVVDVALQVGMVGVPATVAAVELAALPSLEVVVDLVPHLHDAVLYSRLEFALWSSIWSTSTY